MTEWTDVPVGFDMPDGWVAVDPKQVGADGAAYVVVKYSDDPGFRANVTIGVTRRDDDEPIETAVGESLRRLAQAFEVSIVDKSEVGNDGVSGIAQVLRLRTLDGELVRSQVHLTIPLGDTPRDRLVVELACTCRPAQATSVLPDFQRLVASFHVRDRQEGSRDRR